MKIQMDRSLFKVQYLLALGIVVTQVLGKTNLTSILFACTFFITALLWLVVAGRKISPTQWLVISILLISCLSVAGNALLAGKKIGVAYLKKLLIFWSTVLFFGAAADSRPERQDVQFFLNGNHYLALCLIGMYFFRREEMYLWNGRRTQYLTFGFTNPNLAAVFLAAVCILEWIHWAWSQRAWERLLHGGAAVVFAWFSWKTQARNAQILLLFFFASGLLPALIGRKRGKMPGWLPWLIGIFPLAFALCYLGVVQSEWVQRWFGFWITEGKNLDSRSQIWLYAWKQFGKSPLLGSYSQITSALGGMQMHNSHLDVLVSYGAPVLALIWTLLAQMLKTPKCGLEKRQWLCMAGFAALLLSGMGEAMLFSGGLGIYIFAGIIRLLANLEAIRRD